MNRHLHVVPPVEQHRPALRLVGPLVPRRLSPRHAPLRVRVRLGLAAANNWVARAPREERLFWLLIVSAAAAVITGLVVMEHRYPSEWMGGAR